MTTDNNMQLENNYRTVKGETIRELAHRHLLNEHHTTTDEELENVRFEFSDNIETPYRSEYEIDNTNTPASHLNTTNLKESNTRQGNYSQTKPFTVAG